MAKSMRSKVKRSFRSKKREEGVYAAVEAARLQRISVKLKMVRDTDKEGDVELAEAEGMGTDAKIPEENPNIDPSNPDSMELDGTAAAAKASGKVSTHGPRGSRREEWRTSKGMAPRPKSRGMNRQGGIAAKQGAGRPHRRR